MRLATPWLAIMALSILTAVPSYEAHACACCVSQAERFEGSRALEPYEKEELGKIKLAANARLSLNEAGFNDVKGIDRPTEEYKVALVKALARWTFTFTADDRRLGRLVLPAPKSARFFEIDPRIPFDRSEKSPAQVNTVWLYKEWRFEHPLTASGFFAAVKDAKMTLVLHGRGNHCFSAEDFTHWTILVQGRNARYTLYGELVPPSAKE